MSEQMDHVRNLLAEHLPDYKNRDILPLGAGLENVSYLVGGDLVVRLRRVDDAAADASLRREIHLLTVVGRHTHIAVPRPLFSSVGMFAYPAMPGVPLIGLPLERRLAWAAAIADALGRLTAAMQAITDTELGLPTDVEDYSLDDWLDEARECYAEAQSTVPDRHRPQIERFLDAAVPPATANMVFGHNDLGAEHVLIDSAGAVTGVIDWSDAGFDDPAIDMGLILRDFGPVGYDAAAQHSTVRDQRALRDRAEFFAKCRLLEDLRFGLERARSEYVANSVTAMRWLFPD